MKKCMRAICMIGIATLISHTLLAREWVGSSNSPTVGGNKPVSNSGSNKAAACAPAVFKYSLNFNDVNALLEMGGVLFEDRVKGVSAYEVPKTENGNGPKAIFAAALWMGGKDVNGQLKLAAVRFRQVGNDFWGGPLTVSVPYAPDVNFDPSQPVGDNTIKPYGDATITDVQCSKYDKMFPINKAAVIRFSVWWESCIGPDADPGVCSEIDDESLPTSSELDAIYQWPAHGDLSLFQDYYLAPFYDRPTTPGGTGNGVYDPVESGDYPWFDDIMGRNDIECGIDRRVSLFGDQTTWWVFNDKGNVHTESQGEPIGMEIRAQAFAFATSDEINRMTFYNYELINRGTQTLTETFFSQWVDADLGYGADDYVGCDVSRGLGYAYNGDNMDETNGSQIGYQSNPPAIGVDFFEGPYQDSDGEDNPGPVFDSLTNTWGLIPGMTVADYIAEKGIVYRGIGTGYGDGLIDNERFGMRRFTYFTNAASYPVTDPSTANQYYNFMSGTWADGSEMYYGGDGYLTNTQAPIESDYMFPGDSDPFGWATEGQIVDGNWSEADEGNPAGDRRFVQSAGPFTLKPGASNNITVGIVYGRAAGGDLLASVEVMKIADTKAQALFDACFKILDPPNAPKLDIQELNNELILTLSNPLSSNNKNEEYEELDEINIPTTASDRTYNFEGYQIFQMVDDAASVADIRDDSKARLVAQCDVKNDIKGNIVNFELNENINLLEPKLMVVGENAGIKHSFRITEDEFALGTAKGLVNHKTYYYIAVAYGYNQYKKYDPNDPAGLDGQRTPYVSSRLSFNGTAVKAVSAVPHNPMPEADGTYSYIEYGSTPKITRLDGTGNGNRALELTASSKNTILANGFMENPTYEFGGGPINVKVIDPLNVKGGYYELRFINYGVHTGSVNAADTAEWEVLRYENGVVVETIGSERTIASDNEQLIPEWGVAIQINQHKYTPPASGAGNITTLVTNPISASLNFKDSTKRWLSFIQDNDIFYPTNWIRSGTTTDSSTAGPDYLQPNNYRDELGQDNDKLFAKLLGGGVAPHRLTGYQASFMPLAYSPNLTSQPARVAASLSYVPSVDIVMTPDKSLWTRCPVIELGRDAALNVGGAEAGEMRKSQSVDKNGNPDGTGTGMGWFPGYAIDLETGCRLHLAFGENSFLVADGGKDMIWNPSSRMTDNQGNPVFGGVQPIWVFGVYSRTINVHSSLQDFPYYNPNDIGNNAVQQELALMEAGTDVSNAGKRLYGNLMWIVNPLLTPGTTLLSTEATIKLRANKEYKTYSQTTTGVNGGRPMYSWNMDEIATTTSSRDALAEALEMINVVPNPYLAYSEYERSRLDTRVKITNLPEKCTVKIYTTNGKLVRTFKKDSPVTSLDWDLNNSQRIAVASGVYLIHVEVPDIGERVLKAFIGVRQIDLQGI